MSLQDHTHPDRSTVRGHETCEQTVSEEWEMPGLGTELTETIIEVRLNGLRLMNSDLDELFERLARSTFRRRFHLRAAEREYLESKGLDAVMSHGEKFIEERLAPADPPNDGKQTPMRNHPIFVAQHATATCCRGCLEKWHSIPKGHALTSEEKAYVLSVLRRWLISQGGA